MATGPLPATFNPSGELAVAADGSLWLTGTTTTSGADCILRYVPPH